MKRSLKNLCIAASAIAAASSAHAASIASYDFSSDQVTGNFNQYSNAPAQNTQYAYSATGGVTSGSGSVAKTTATDVTLIYNGAGSSLDFTSGETFTVSTMLKLPQANSIFGVGFTEANNQGFYTGTSAPLNTYDSINFRWRGTAAGDGFQAQTVNNGAAVNTVLLPGFALDINNWYKVTLSLTRTATTGVFSYSASFENFGTTGDSFVSSLSSGTGTINNANLWNDTSIFAGARVSTAGNLDNFELSTAPEPSAALLSALGVVGLLRRRRN